VNWRGVPVPITMDPRQSHKHSQESDWNKDGDMERKRSDFIKDNERRAGTERFGSQPSYSQNYHFGQSRHPVQDAGSPSHAGQYYATPTLLSVMILGPSPVSANFLAGLASHKYGERKIDANTLVQLVNDERARYKEVFGADAYARSTRNQRFAMSSTYEFINSQYFSSDEGYGEVVDCVVEGESCF